MMEKKSMYSLLTATYDDGTIKIVGEGGRYQVFINEKEVPLVKEININFQPLCLPVMKITAFIRPSEQRVKTDE